MSTGTSIIIDALKEIGVSSVVSPPAPESIDDGRRKLNSMLAMWFARNIDIGIKPLGVAGDNLDEPDGARNGIVTNLALELAPLFSNGKQVVSEQLKSTARREFMSIKSLYSDLKIPGKVLSSTTPLGAGNQIWDDDGSSTFWRRGVRVKN
jgi:hypothetical protein